MGKENLNNTEARKKFRELVDDITICMFATQLDRQPLSVVPMYTKEVDEAGNLWFLSLRDSDHNRDIENNSACQLLFSDGSGKFLSVYGFSEIHNDRERIESLFSKMDKAWFDGPEDPKITAIKFTPDQAAYWSNDHNKLVTLFKLGTAAITGNDKDVGTSGELNL